MAKILLIETDHLLAKNLRQYLNGSGHETVWHVDPQAAMDFCDSTRPDAIILDVTLAARSGIEFLYEFRSYPEWQKLPVVIFSNITADGAGCIEAFEQLNIAAYRYKPTTSLAQLAQTLEHALQPTTV